MLSAFPFILLVVVFQLELHTIVKEIRAIGQDWWLFAVSTILITASWILYVWAVLNNYVTESAMGYYLTPLLTVLAALIFFRERLTRLQIVAVLSVSVTVAYAFIGLSSFPWVGISLGLLMALYSVCRKKARMGALAGMFLETAIMFPIGIIGLWYFSTTELALMSDNNIENALLAGSGAFTVLPIIFYVAASRRLTLSTAGILFYFAPTCSFLLGIFYYNEPFGQSEIILFSGIWIALLIYSFDSLQLDRLKQHRHQ